jgi:hypothetical protein
VLRILLLRNKCRRAKSAQAEGSSFKSGTRLSPAVSDPNHGQSDAVAAVESGLDGLFKAMFALIVDFALQKNRKATEMWEMRSLR